MTGPPYWAFAYPLPTWLANTTVGQVEADLPSFGERYTAGADPSVVVAGSGFWDIASWWMHDGNFSKNWAAGPGYIPRYVAGVTAFVEALRARSAGTLAHDAPWAQALRNRAARRLDVQRGCACASVGHGPATARRGANDQALSPLAPPPRFPRPKEHGAPYGTMDGRHLHEWLNIALLNVLLNIVRQAEKPCAHAAWHNAFPKI